nr:UDP-N-acetylglucosamine 2-epimerase (non-hydrolyzing) [uncultured Holophaga sp.]
MKILCAMGTRPEVIKMAPVVRALRRAGFEAPVLVTAQHRDLLDQMLKVMELESDWDLDAMRPSQRLADLTGILVPGVFDLLAASRPDVVLAQGDTTTVFCVALAAFYARIPFGHVEAGLRSGNLNSPFPEEANRKLAGVLANWHFAPTEQAREALLAESVSPDKIHVVGNTVIDSLLSIAGRENLPWPQGVPMLGSGERLVLLTLHRRENFGEPIERILKAVREFAIATGGVRVVYPVHPNPNVQGPAHRILGGIPNVHLVDPLDYPTLVGLMRSAYLVLTDSGGIQEEAPALGKPVLVFREVTERPEAVAAGGVTLVGSDPEDFRMEAARLFSDSSFYRTMAKPRFPYGKGDSGERIASIFCNGCYPG